MPVEWVIYYADGARVTSLDCAPQDVPKGGVAVILSRDGRCGRRVLAGSDFYLWSPTLGMWTRHIEAVSAMMRAVVSEPWVAMLRGEYQREADYEQILIRAHNDPDLPAVSPGTPPHPAWKV